MPPFIQGLKNVLDTFAGWLIYLVPAIIVITFIWGGIALSRAEDSVDTKQIKEKMTRTILGTALAGSATWIGNWLWGILG